MQPGNIRYKSLAIRLVRSHAEPCREVERAALAVFALHPDCPFHQLDKPLRDGKAEARAAIFPRGRSIRLREGLEHPRALLWGHADAAVAHRELHLHPIG